MRELLDYRAEFPILEHTTYLINHSLAAMPRRAEDRLAEYARMWGEDEDAWGFVALVHDFDYEKYPDRENHPYRGVEMLKTLGYPDWVTRAVLRFLLPSKQGARCSSTRRPR